MIKKTDIFGREKYFSGEYSPQLSDFGCRTYSYSVPATRRIYSLNSKNNYPQLRGNALVFLVKK